MRTCGVLYTTLALTIIVVAVASAQLPATVPLPVDLKVVPPGSTVSPEQAKFSGKWFGVWDGNVLEHILVVEEIDGTEAKVIYAFGAAPSWNIYQPGWFRARGQFVKGSLVAETRRATIIYRMNRDGTLSATYEGKGTSAYSTAKLLRVD